MTLTVKKYDGHLEFKYIVQFEDILNLDTWVELEMWCGENIKNNWWSDVESIHGRRSCDRFWFVSEQDAGFFILRWS